MEFSVQKPYCFFIDLWMNLGDLNEKITVFSIPILFGRRKEESAVSKREKDTVKYRLSNDSR